MRVKLQFLKIYRKKPKLRKNGWGLNRGSFILLINCTFFLTSIMSRKCYRWRKITLVFPPFFQRHPITVASVERSSAATAHETESSLSTVSQHSHHRQRTSTAEAPVLTRSSAAGERKMQKSSLVSHHFQLL